LGSTSGGAQRVHESAFKNFVKICEAKEIYTAVAQDTGVKYLIKRFQPSQNDEFEREYKNLVQVVERSIGCEERLALGYIGHCE
jgi:hypothetical protein